MYSDIKKYYKDKTVLVTGHTGFKGSWLTLWLTLLGANVIGYSLDTYTKKDNYNFLNLKDSIVDVRDNILNFKKLKEVFDIYKPEIVFHLAAQAIVKQSYKEPAETFKVNTMGTLNVLECIKNTKSVKNAVIITTDKCYENKEQIWGYRETDKLGGNDPYSASKACAEIITNSYVKSFMNIDNYSEHKKAVATVRAGNVIGGGDWSKYRLLPDCIRALEKNEEILIRNPYSVRPWQYVLEPLSGYIKFPLKLEENPHKYSGAWNFGPKYEDTVNVEEFVNIVINYWGNGSYKKSSDKSSEKESNLLFLDTTKANYYLDWKPKYSIYEAIEKTVLWYKNYKNKDIKNYCINEIESYMNLK